MSLSECFSQVMYLNTQRFLFCAINLIKLFASLKYFSLSKITDIYFLNISSNKNNRIYYTKYINLYVGI